ncbi:ATP-binding protein [Listeria ilorinensis]|uniref:ATP-binding protein n=1 Tax=Listeria ilorinensis TaxID=2867439 RepID=UPI001EF6FE94|nr:ATP-binding protein [Listeria ilorinensis]
MGMENDEIPVPQNVKITAGEGKGLELGGVKFVENRICETCGREYPVYSRNGIETSICIHCENDKVQQEMQKAHDAATKKRPHAIMKRFSFVPDEIRQASFESFKAETPEEQEALQQLINFVKNFKDDQTRTIMMSGSTGTGKTHLAYATAREVIKQGYVAIFVTVPELLESIRDTFSNNDSSQAEIKKIYKEADLLVMDDIGAEYVRDNSDNSWVAETIFDIINARTTKATIYTTNLSGQALTQHYGGIHGKRIVSRIKNNSTAIQLVGRDRRVDDGW